MQIVLAIVAGLCFAAMTMLPKSIDNRECVRRALDAAHVYSVIRSSIGTCELRNRRGDHSPRPHLTRIWADVAQC